MSKIASAAYQLPSDGRTFEEIDTTIRHQVDQLINLPGFLYYRLLRPIAPDDPYTVLTFWQSNKHYREAIRNLRASLSRSKR